MSNLNEIPRVIGIQRGELERGQYDWVDFAEAHVNSLRNSLLLGDSVFAHKLFLAMDMPELAHHGHHHSRHVEKIAEWELRIVLDHPKYIDKFEAQDPFLKNDLIAFSMFHYFHDLDQQMTAVWNQFNRKKEKPVHEKRGHGIAGAIMAIAMADRLSESTGISNEDARRVTRTASIMMLRHDDPKRFDKTFDPSNKSANQIVQDAKELKLDSDKILFEAFYQDRVDVFSLSPKQLLTILKMSKVNKSGQPEVTPGSKYGLDPDFEKEFEDRLVEMNEDESPLMQDNELTADRKERAVTLTELAYFADMSDMICPYTDQITRTLITQYSKQRPFSTFIDPGLEINNPELFQRMHESDGNGLLADDERFYWELLNFGNIRENSDLLKIVEINKFVREHIVCGALAVKQIGLEIMGDKPNLFIGIYHSRIESYGNKFENRIQKFPGDFTKLQKVFMRKVDEIVAERNTLIRFVQNEKPGHGEFTAVAIQKFENFCEGYIQDLKNHYFVTNEEFAEWEVLVSQYKILPSQPFSSSDSLPVRRFKVINPETKKIEQIEKNW